MSNFQREGVKSNAQVGREFEKVALDFFGEMGVTLTSDRSIEIGVHNIKKAHKFDLGSAEPPILVECKSHKWTGGNNVPSAKLTVWNEAMYFFSLAPQNYRKIFFCLRDVRSKGGETLAEYYIRNFVHLIPSEVEFWEYDEASKSGIQLR